MLASIVTDDGKRLHLPKPPSRIDTDAKWDALITLILDKSLYLVEVKSDDGIPRFDAPSLSPSDRRLLSADRYAGRTAARLKERFKHQGLEINRVVRWLASIEKDEAKYPINEHRLSIAKAPAHIKTMIARYRGDPAIDAARYDIIQKRHDRAQANALAATTKPQKAVRDDPPLRSINELLLETFETRRREARSIYPETKVAETKEVRAFLNALRDCAGDAKITELADQVARSQSAHADVMKHGADLATAYQKYAADTMARQARQDRMRRQDFGRER